MLTISEMEARAEMHWEAWLLVNSLKNGHGELGQITWSKRAIT